MSGIEKQEIENLARSMDEEQLKTFLACVDSGILMEEIFRKDIGKKIVLNKLEIAVQYLCENNMV